MAASLSTNNRRRTWQGSSENASGGSARTAPRACGGAGDARRAGAPVLLRPWRARTHSKALSQVYVERDFFFSFLDFKNRIETLFEIAL